jgi:hypothetical protein
MRRHQKDSGLIPIGFEITAHDCFKEFHYPPVSLIKLLDLQDILNTKHIIDDNNILENNKNLINDNDLLDLNVSTNIKQDIIKPNHIIDNKTNEIIKNEYITNYCSIDLKTNITSESTINENNDNDNKIEVPLNNNDLIDMKKRLSEKRKEILLTCKKANNTETVKEEIEKEKKNDNNIDVCSICLSSYNNPATLLQCNHSFCSDCIIYWMISTSLCCPLCKTEGQFFITSTNGDKIDNKIKVWKVYNKTMDDSSVDNEQPMATNKKMRFSPRGVNDAVLHHNKKFLHTVDDIK